MNVLELIKSDHKIIKGQLRDHYDPRAEKSKKKRVLLKKLNSMDDENFKVKVNVRV